MVEPVNPFQNCELDGVEALPWRPPMDDFGFLTLVDALGEGVVIAVVEAADRGLDARFRQALGVANRHVLAAVVAMMNQVATMQRSPLMKRLFQRFEHKAHNAPRTPF